MVMRMIIIMMIMAYPVGFLLLDNSCLTCKMSNSVNSFGVRSHASFATGAKSRFGQCKQTPRNFQRISCPVTTGRAQVRTDRLESGVVTMLLLYHYRHYYD